MKLVDMKNEKKPKDSKCSESVCCAEDEYPYGLRLNFNSPQVKKMPSLMSFKVGDKVNVVAEATVVTMRSSTRMKGEDENSIELQVEKVGCEPAVSKPVGKMSPKEYREARESGKVK